MEDTEITAGNCRPSLAVNTGWMAAAQVSRVVVQGAAFILLVRGLGVADYGKFVAVTAFLGILAPFSGWGGGNVMIMNVARKRSLFRTYWGNVLLISLGTGALLLLLALALRDILLPFVTAKVLFAMALSELFFLRFVEFAGQAFQSVEKLALTAWVQIFPGLIRLGCVIGFLASGTAGRGLEAWVDWYVWAGAAAGLGAILLVGRRLGSPSPSLPLLMAQLKLGFHFSIGICAKSVYGDIDKTMLARLATADAAGIYAAAARIIFYAFTPVQSLLAAANARFFRCGAEGLNPAVLFAMRLLPYAAGYGIVSAAALYLLAPLLPAVLGDGFAQSVGALRLLAAVPFIQAVHYLLADSLTGAGYQSVRSAFQIFIGLFNVALNLLVIPRYSWRGAAWATVASEALLAILLMAAVARLRRGTAVLPGIEADMVSPVCPEAASAGERPSLELP
jgi:O-antigen/teichoic acid export membrane protein